MSKYLGSNFNLQYVILFSLYVSCMCYRALWLMPLVLFESNVNVCEWKYIDALLVRLPICTIAYRVLPAGFSLAEL